MLLKNTETAGGGDPLTASTLCSSTFFCEDEGPEQTLNVWDKWWRIKLYKN